jgi:molybdate transport system permease protein
VIDYWIPWSRSGTNDSVAGRRLGLDIPTVDADSDKLVNEAVKSADRVCRPTGFAAMVSEAMRVARSGGVATGLAVQQETRSPARRRIRTSMRLEWLLLPGSMLLILIFVPLGALVWRAVAGAAIWPEVRSPAVGDALRLSVVTSTVTVVFALLSGTPLAYMLARRRFPGRRVVETLIDLPLVLPPVVAGVALLIAFGRRGVLGEELGWFGISLPFSTSAVVVAQIFVAAPFYVRGARVGFAAVAKEFEEAAAIDGASSWRVFRDVTWPLAWPGIAAGAILCWARAISEFGATLMFAGNLPGRTQTMPLAIMASFERDLATTLLLALLLLGFSAAVLTSFRVLAPSAKI